MHISSGGSLSHASMVYRLLRTPLCSCYIFISRNAGRCSGEEGRGHWKYLGEGARVHSQEGTYKSGVYKEMSSILADHSIAPAYMSADAGGGGKLRGSYPMSTAVQRSPNKLWRSNCIFNLWYKYCQPLFYPVPHYDTTSTLVYESGSTARWTSDESRRSNDYCLPVSSVLKKNASVLSATWTYLLEHC
jgi:hypothetical protein